jgi:phage terminase Nu1 subunit (DNA packaging protein)
MPSIIDRAALADILSVTERTTFNLEKKGMPCVGRSRFDADACLAWYQEYLQTGCGKPSSLIEADTRLRTAQAGIQELKLAQAQGESFPAGVVVSAWEKAVTSCRARILSVPGKLAPQVVSCNSIAEVKDAIERALFECLDELAIADYSGVFAEHKEDDASGDGSMGSPAKAYRKRVGRPVSKAKPRRQR